MRPLRIVFLGLCAVALAARPAWAHRVKVFAYVENRTVLGYGYMAGGERTKDCPVTVLLPDGTTLVAVRTDGEGRFAFQATVRADLKIVLDAGPGHRAEWTVSADQLPADLPPFNPAHPPPQPPQPPATRPETAPTTRPGPGGAIDPEDLRAIVRQEVREALRPIREELLREKEPGPTEIIGGIGYLLGLMGLVAYFRSRAARNRPPAATGGVPRPVLPGRAPIAAPRDETRPDTGLRPPVQP